MLEGKNGGWYEYSYLFAFRRYLEGSAHGYFGLAESHISADEPVHRHRALEVALYVGGCFCLIGRVLVEERSLQLMLHVSIGCARETFLLLTGRVEADEVARNVFDFVLGSLFEPLPCTGT